MDILAYKEKLNEIKKYKSSDMMGFLLIGIETVLTVAAILLIFSNSILQIIVGQILLGMIIIRWQILFHDLAHYALFKTKKLNQFFGYLVSILSFQPFHNYRLIHEGHHKWSGWHDNDPDLDVTLPEKLTPAKRWMLDFCWKYWIPIMLMSYPVEYWNLKKIKKLVKTKQDWFYIALGMLFIVIAWFTIIYLVGIDNLILLLPGIIISLILCEPILIAHHMDIPQKRTFGQDVLSHPYYQQDQYARHTIYPRWFAVYCFYNFNAHVDHHLFPKIPCYHLHKVHVTTEHESNWLDWIKFAKKKKAHELIFSNSPRVEG